MPKKNITQPSLKKVKFKIKIQTHHPFLSHIYHFFFVIIILAAKNTHSSKVNLINKKKKFLKN